MPLQSFQISHPCCNIVPRCSQIIRCSHHAEAKRFGSDRSLDGSASNNLCIQYLELYPGRKAGYNKIKEEKKVALPLSTSLWYDYSHMDEGVCQLAARKGGLPFCSLKRGSEA